jgi:hypothetical protein
LSTICSAHLLVGQGQGQSVDAELRDVTAESYRRDYNVIKEFIPDIQLRQVRTRDINRIFDALIQDDGETVRAQSLTCWRHARSNRGENDALRR